MEDVGLEGPQGAWQDWQEAARARGRAGQRGLKIMLAGLRRRCRNVIRSQRENFNMTINFLCKTCQCWQEAHKRALEIIHFQQFMTKHKFSYEYY